MAIFPLTPEAKEKEYLEKGKRTSCLIDAAILIIKSGALGLQVVIVHRIRHRLIHKVEGSEEEVDKVPKHAILIFGRFGHFTESAK